LGTLAAWKLVILGGEGGGVALATGILASVVDPYSVVSPPITVVITDLFFLFFHLTQM